MLHLFGFNLPETHHRYFLASSFTDFWRRINIYWKDFMMKVFYYPAYFRLRKLGDTKALVLATAFTFLVDLVSASGAVVLDSRLGAHRVERHHLLDDLAAAGARELALRIEAGRARTLKRAADLARERGLVLRTVGTFCVICVLWSLWTAESMTDWMLMMACGGHVAAVDSNSGRAVRGRGLAGALALAVYAVRTRQVGRAARLVRAQWRP